MTIQCKFSKWKYNYFREYIRPSSLKICTKGRHNPIIERSIHTMKQGARCTAYYVPYKRYTRLVTISLVELMIHSRNYFTQKGRISKRLGSNTILLGIPNTGFNMMIFFEILRYGIHRDNKNIKDNNHTKYCLKGIKLIRRKLVYVSIHRQRDSQQILGRINHRG